MEYILIDRFAPLVVARRTGAMDAANMTAMLADYQSRLESATEKLAIVYDAGSSDAGRPDAAARRIAASWFRSQSDLLARRCAGLDFAFPSAVSRGVLTAIFWIAQPPVPTAMHGSPRDAVASAAARVRRRDIDPYAVIAALDARS